MRLDSYLNEKYPNISRSRWQKVIAQGKVLVNGRSSTSKDKKLDISSDYCIEVPDVNTLTEVGDTVPLPSEMDLDIIYEDDSLIVLNKPRGIVVHPGAGTCEPTLVSGLLHHCGDNLSKVGGEDRLGIVHRIDKDTSGLLMVAKTDEVHNELKKQLEKHSVTRVYLAIVLGNFKEDEGIVDYPIGRYSKNRIKKAAVVSEAESNETCISGTIRPAYTGYKVIKNFRGYSLIECKLRTGRTHQIRVHMSSIGHPIVGDPLYGPKKSPWKINGQMLHAKTIGFIHPIRREFLQFSLTPPDDFKRIIGILELKS